MPGASLKDEWNAEACVEETFYHFPPLEEAKHNFTEKHGDVVFPETDEIAMVKVRKEAAEALEAEAEHRRIHAGLSVAINEYREAANAASHRINRFEKDKTNSEEAKARYVRDQATVYAADARLSEQRRRLHAGEALLGPEEGV